MPRPDDPGRPSAPPARPGPHSPSRRAHSTSGIRAARRLPTSAPPAAGSPRRHRWRWCRVAGPRARLPWCVGATARCSAYRGRPNLAPERARRPRPALPSGAIGRGRRAAPSDQRLSPDRPERARRRSGDRGKGQHRKRKATVWAATPPRRARPSRSGRPPSPACARSGPR